MTPEQAALWQRIAAFELDEPDAEFSFSARLARENGWKRDYARRVIAEYQRFAFLAMTAGHPVTPSKAIDEAWHLHLIYTRSYWERFCPHVLGRPLHHEPSRGSAADEKKFAAHYAQTRASYAEFFGAEPPTDIWPAPVGPALMGRATNGAAAARKTDRARPWLPFATASLALAGCGGAAVASLGPLDLRGPEFLVFFCWFALAGFGGALALRWWLRGAVGTVRLTITNQEPYLVAVLAGPERVLDVALTNLAARYLLNPDRTSRVVRSKARLPADAPAVEQAILEVARGESGADLAALHAATAEAIAPGVETLRSAGLLLSEAAARRVQFVPAGVAALVPAVGILKIAIGLSRGRPVETLVAFCVATAALSLLFLVRPWRTRAGDRELARLRATLARPSQRLPNGALSDETNLTAIALFGASVLPVSVMALRTAMRPTSSDSGSSGCSSGGSGGDGGFSCGGCSGH